MKRLKDLSENRDIIDFGAYTFYEALSEQQSHKIKKHSLEPNSYANHVYVTRSIFRLEFLGKYQIRFEDGLAYSEDSLFQCLCIIRNASRLQLRETGYYFRYRSGSATATNSVQAQEKKLASYCYVSNKYKQLYHICSSAHKPIVADLLMSNRWLALYGIIYLSTTLGSKTLKELKTNGLYPYHRPVECSLYKSYQTTHSNFIGKAFDRIYINMHRPSGFAAMKLLCKLIGLKHIVKK